MYKIYRIWNLKTRKIYIGRTTQPLLKRWGAHKCHGTYDYAGTRKGYLQTSMKKYGVENFEIREIATAKSFKEMVFLEGFYIKYYQSNNSKYGYNLVIEKYEDGLEFQSEETKNKRRVSGHRRLRPDLIGVGTDKFRNKYYSRFSHNGNSFAKRFNTLEEAKENYDKLALFYCGSNALINNEHKRSDYLKEDLQAYVNHLSQSKFAPQNKYKGVFKEGKGFNSTVYVNKKIVFIGYFSTERDAAIQRDKVSFYLFGHDYKLQFSESFDEKTYKKEGEEIYKYYISQNKLGTRKTKRPPSSCYKGVNRATKSLWEASLTLNKVRNRKFFKSEKDAAEQVNKWVLAANLLKERLNCIN